MSLKCKKKYAELMYFKSSVWNFWWWFLGNQNMSHCYVSFIKFSCVWLLCFYCYFTWTL